MKKSITAEELMAAVNEATRISKVPAGYFTVAQYAKAHGCCRSKAQRDIDKAMEEGLLINDKVQRVFGKSPTFFYGKK